MRKILFLVCATAPALFAAPALADAATEDPGGRVQASLTGGVVLPSQFTPNIVFPTYTGVGPYVRLEASLRPLHRLEVGTYASFSDHPIASIHCGDYCAAGATNGDETGASIGGSVVLFSGGVFAKLRFDPTPWATVRFGATVGADYVSFPLQRGGGTTETMPGAGLQVGANADFRARVADHLALLVQLGFLAQPVGTATFPHDSDYPDKGVAFSFPPTLYLGAGPEVFF